MSAELSDGGIIGIERILRCRDESHAGSHQACDKGDENRRRTGKLRKKSGGAQGDDECGA